MAKTEAIRISHRVYTALVRIKLERLAAGKRVTFSEAIEELIDNALYVGMYGQEKADELTGGTE